MVKVFLKILIALTMVIPALKSFGAETTKLRHAVSVYSDEKAIGFKVPEGIACNDKGLLVVGDTGNDRLVKCTFVDKNIKAGAEIKIPQLLNPLRVQINSKSEIFALDGKQRRIVRLNPDGEFKGFLNPEGIPSPSSFIPRSFKIDSNDTIYILDIFSDRVLVLAPDGKFQKQIVFPNHDGFFSDLAVDFKGNILLIDSTKRMLFSVPKDGTTFSPVGGNLKEYLNFPASIATDDRGTIYIVDQNGAGIVVLAQDGSFLGRLLSMGWTEGLLYYPSQICINNKGEVFIADRGNSRIQIFTLVK